MKNELKQDFTRRLSQCNSGQMIVIIYDIFFAYQEDAREAWNQKNHEEYKTAIRKAQSTLDELIGALDFKYPIAGNLYQLYSYCKNELAKALYEFRLERVDGVDSIMSRLYTSFVEAAKQDQTGPLMKNAQQVYAGMTYGKSDLTENLLNDSHRGFLV